MKTLLMLAALLATAAVAQATPRMSKPKIKHPVHHTKQVRTIFHLTDHHTPAQQRNVGSEGHRVASGPVLNHPETAPGPH